MCDRALPSDRQVFKKRLYKSGIGVLLLRFLENGTSDRIGRWAWEHSPPGPTFLGLSATSAAEVSRRLDEPRSAPRAR